GGRLAGRPCHILAELGDDALPAAGQPPRLMEATPRTRRTPGQERLQPHSHDGEPPRPAPVSRLSAAAGSCRKSPADGPIRLSGRIPAGGGTRSNILSPGQHPPPPAPREG